jgi:hypothetical protein
MSFKSSIIVALIGFNFVSYCMLQEVRMVHGALSPHKRQDHDDRGRRRNSFDSLIAPAYERKHQAASKSYSKQHLN